MSAIWKLGSSLYGWYNGYPDPFEIQANPENLRKAIQEKGKAIINYKFKEIRPNLSLSFTPLDYAIKIGDKQSAEELFRLEAHTCRSLRSAGTYVHYFIECLEENNPPNIELLTLLLNNMADMNEIDSGDFLTILERALAHLSFDKNIHWDVIELLLKRGVRITQVAGYTPFMIFRDSQNNKVRERSLDQQKAFLKNLARYLDLEKTYHPESKSCLTLIEFKFHFSRLKNEFSRTSIYLSTADVVSSGFAGLQEDLKDPSFSIPMVELERLQQITATFQQNAHQAEFAEVQKAIQTFIDYHELFLKLVKEGSFMDCFDTWQLNSMIPSLKKLSETDIAARQMLAQINKWNLSRPNIN